MTNFVSVFQYAELKGITLRCAQKRCKNGIVRAQKRKVPGVRRLTWFVDLDSEEIFKGDGRSTINNREKRSSQLIPYPREEKGKEGAVREENEDLRRERAEKKEGEEKEERVLTTEALYEGLEKRTLTMKEAARVHKIEQAIKMNLDNRLKAKEVINFEKIKGDFEEIIKTLLDGLREQVEKWGVQYNFSPARSIEMQETFENTLQESFEKLKELLK